MADAEEMTALAAAAIGAEADEVLVASTGVIGKRLPMPLIRQAVRGIALSPEGGHDFARAIMTTDTVPKEIAVTVQDGERQVHHRRGGQRLRHDPPEHGDHVLLS